MTNNSTQTSSTLNGYTGWNMDATANSTNPYTTFVVTKKVDEKGINPSLYFNYVKRKFGIIESMRMDKRKKQIEKAFYAAVENGQDVLAEKFLNILAKETKEAVLYAKGIKFFINRDELNKYKYKIRGGHISDTRFDAYTRVIPKDILKKKKSFEGVFDEFVIYHAYIEELEEKREKKQKITPAEKSKMKDPVLFGTIKENPGFLYFIDQWDDELCDLSFDEMVDVMGKNEKDYTLKATVDLKV